ARERERDREEDARPPVAERLPHPLEPRVDAFEGRARGAGREREGDDRGREDGALPREEDVGIEAERPRPQRPAAREQREEEVADRGRREDERQGEEGLDRRLAGEALPRQRESGGDGDRRDEDRRPEGHAQRDEEDLDRGGLEAHSPFGTMNPKRSKTF